MYFGFMGRVIHLHFCRIIPASSDQWRAFVTAVIDFRLIQLKLNSRNSVKTQSQTVVNNLIYQESVNAYMATSDNQTHNNQTHNVVNKLKATIKL